MKKITFAIILFLLFLLSVSSLLYAQENTCKEAFSFHTTLPAGSSFKMGLHCRQLFYIDWGDGIQVPFESGNYGVNDIQGKVRKSGWIRIFCDTPTDIISLYLGNDLVNQQIDDVDLSRLKELKFFYCQNNLLNAVDISQCFRLMELNVAANRLKELDLRNAPFLDMLVCQDNELQELDLSPIQSLMALRCENNRISSLDLRHFKQLSVLKCGGNPITELDLSQNRLLQQLLAPDTKVKIWDLTPHGDLRVLDLSGVENPSIKWGSKEELRQIFLNRCQLSSIFLPPLPQINRLEVEENQLSSISLEGMPLLKDLRCGGNRLKSLNLHKVPLLHYLFAEGNQLTAVDLSRCKEIRELLLSYNQILSIDVSHCPDLYLLWLSKNPIEKIDITPIPKLFSLFLDDCKLSDESIINVIAKLPDIKAIKPNERTSWWKTWLLLKGNPFTTSPDTKRASQMGWKVDLADNWSGRDNSALPIISTDRPKIVRVGDRLVLDTFNHLPSNLLVWLYTLSGELVDTAQTSEEPLTISLRSKNERYLCIYIVDGEIDRTIL